VARDAAAAQHRGGRDAYAFTLIFRVPRGTRFLRLVSSAAVPEGGARRVLGVCVTGISMGDQRMAFYDPALRGGWHGLERDSGRTWRWTGGDAALVVPCAAVASQGALTRPRRRLVEGFWSMRT